MLLSKTKQFKASAGNHRKSKIFDNLKGLDANFAPQNVAERERESGSCISITK